MTAAAVYLVAASSGFDTSLIAPIITGVAVACTGLGALVAYALRRRGESGSVDTSSAGVLWQQSQTMLASSQEARFKAEQQRDLLLAAQTTQVVPMLSAINDVMNQTLATMKVIDDKLGRLDGSASKNH